MEFVTLLDEKFGSLSNIVRSVYSFLTECKDRCECMRLFSKFCNIRHVGKKNLCITKEYTRCVPDDYMDVARHVKITFINNCRLQLVTQDLIISSSDKVGSLCDVLPMQSMDFILTVTGPDPMVCVEYDVFYVDDRRMFTEPTFFMVQDEIYCYDDARIHCFYTKQGYHKYTAEEKEKFCAEKGSPYVYYAV